MSVTIVTTLPKPAQTTATDKTVSTGNATSVENPATLDFASLLQGQLQPILPVALEAIQKNTEPTDQTIAESVPSDTAALLAAMGLIQQDPSRKADLPEIAKASLQDNTQVGKTTPDSAPVSLSTTAIADVVQSPKVIVQSGAAAIEEQPAKFAAVTPVTLITENPSTTIVSADTTPNSIPALIGNTPVNTNAPPIRHDLSLAVPTPVRDQGWASDFGQKIVWLASNDKESAQITLNPPQMGPIEISLSMDKGSATASFTSANSEVRNALETAMPKLREMFASAGIELGQTNVSAESFKQQAENGNANRGSSQWRSDNAILGADSAISLSAGAFYARQGNGLVDIFA